MFFLFVSCVFSSLKSEVSSWRHNLAVLFVRQICSRAGPTKQRSCHSWRDSLWAGLQPASFPNSVRGWVSYLGMNLGGILRRCMQGRMSEVHFSALGRGKIAAVGTGVNKGECHPALVFRELAFFSFLEHCTEMTDRCVHL